MNAGGVDKACKSYGPEVARPKDSGERVSNTQITNPKIGHNSAKAGLIPNGLKAVMFWVKEQSVLGWVCGLSACWWGNGSPRRWRVGGVRARSPTMALRHGPYSYGRLQSRIFYNGRKPDGATPRAGRRSSDCKPLLWGEKLLTVPQE